MHVSSFTLFVGVIFLAQIHMSVQQTCDGTGVWSPWGSWGTCSGGTCTCGGTACCTQTSWRNCQPQSGCLGPVTCSGSAYQTQGCSSNVTCGFPKPVCCAGYVRDVVNGVLLCVGNPLVTSTTVLPTTTTTTSQTTTTTTSSGCPGTGSPFTDSDRQALVSQHNSLRSGLAMGTSPTNNMPASGHAARASNMYTMQYDCGLELLAQQWATNCQWQHSTPCHRLGAGENLAQASCSGCSAPGPYASNTAALIGSTNNWWAELVQYGMSTADTTYNSSSSMSNIGHFTQCAWSATLKVGCGLASCPNLQPTMDFTTFVVCNYLIAGNTVGDQIYTIGNGCATPADCTTYPSSTCNPSTSLCSTTYVAPCQDDPSEASSCPSFQSQGYCDCTSEYYTFMTTACPKTCGICT